MVAEISSPRKGGFFWDELDAASGVRNDRGRDADGDDGAAGAVSYCNRGQCKAIQLLVCTDEEGGMGDTASWCIRKSCSEMFAENLAFGIALNLPEEVVIAIRAKELGYIEPWAITPQNMHAAA